MRVAICDDDAAFLDEARRAVRAWSEREGVAVDTRCCADGDELLSLCGRSCQDLVLLDIVMPGISGMDVARELRASSESVRIAFLISSPEYAVDSYEVHAAEYLLKPVSRARLERLLDECARADGGEAPSVVVKTASWRCRCARRTGGCCSRWATRLAWPRASWTACPSLPAAWTTRASSMGWAC